MIAIAPTKESFKHFSDACQSDPLVAFSHLVLSVNGDYIGSLTTPPYELEDSYMLFSMTKSFASLAIGIARDHGLLQLSDPIITYFPQYASQKRGDYLDKITIRDLLTMSAGGEGEGYQAMVTSANWVESFFKQRFCYEPGTRFLYSTPCSHLL